MHRPFRHTSSPPSLLKLFSLLRRLCASRPLALFRFSAYRSHPPSPTTTRQLRYYLPNFFTPLLSDPRILSKDSRRKLLPFRSVCIYGVVSGL
ncbi:hypothetical protein CC86DRAFT_375667 [Ophiobolus disseminans]|uniref:Uncharacterized protein n=1 Tax=Ophiobolus disseminans TaxID=1469910 RepID=A0A6A6ZC78_9PLEO|nr:hypothetical protein CC86DRAFT_375667 [Ophiobolus disseminans]